MKPSVLLDYFVSKKSEMIQSLETLVNFESPSSNKKLLDVLAAHLKSMFEPLASQIEVIEQKKYGNQIKVVFDPWNQLGDNSYNLILCHFDTVWSEGTIQTRPFKISEGKAWGPGVLDMKGGIILTEYAFRAIHDFKMKLHHPIILLLSGDEEIGSMTSRPIIEENVKSAKYVFVPESPLPNGVLKTARKGTARFVIEIEGRAAHSGIEPEKGISAITELAEQVLHINQLSNINEGTTINVGVVEGGTKVNVVAPKAMAEVDVRVWSQDEMDRIDAAFNSLKTFTPGIKIKVSGGFTRPPMERTEEIGNLFEKAKEFAESFGLDLQESPTGGASDGNFTAALGIPTLDGLGPVGEGAHAEHEHVVLDSIPARAALLTSLLTIP